jgi:hypothetical protein
MKYSIPLILFLVFSIGFTYGQTYNWSSSIDSTKHIVSANIGWEYSAIAGANYSYKLPFSQSVLLQTGFSAPFGNEVLDDFKTDMGLSGLVYNSKSFNSILNLNGIYKRYSSELVRLNNIGLDIKTLNGIYKSKWFVSSEIGIELGLNTHFKHTDTYKQTIYADVADGWYKPLSAGIMNLGLQGGLSFNKSDLIYRIGYYKSITSSVNVLIPYYMTLGYNLKFK